MTALIVLATVTAGGLAAVLRWSVSLAFAGRTLPWAVLTVNVVASTIGGIALGLAAAGAIDSGIRLLLLSGVAGGLSTFSTWSVETIQLVRDGRWAIALGSVAANLALGVAAATGGYFAMLGVVG